MSDILERLRDMDAQRERYVMGGPRSLMMLLKQAADEIEELREAFIRYVQEDGKEHGKTLTREQALECIKHLMGSGGMAKRFYAVGLEFFDTEEEARKYIGSSDLFDEEKEILHVEDVRASDVIGNMKKLDVELQMEHMLDELAEMEDLYNDVDCEIYLNKHTSFEAAADDLSSVLKGWADRHVLTNKWRKLEPSRGEE